MSRVLAFLAATLCWAGVAAAQPAAAPTTHAGTKLNFPPTVGGATFVASFNHGNAVSYKYLSGKVQLTVQIFDGGRRVPPGSANPAVTSEFSSEMAEAEQQALASGLTRFEKPAAPGSCSYGTVTFRCTVYSAHSGNGRVYGKFLLTGYRDSFLKINAEWTQADGLTLADADKTLNAFVPALMQ